MSQQIVQQYENYGRVKAPDAMNKFLEENPKYRVASVTPTRIDFEGGQRGSGVMVVFERDVQP